MVMRRKLNGKRVAAVRLPFILFLREGLAGRLELFTFRGVDLRIGEAEFFERFYYGG